MTIFEAAPLILEGLPGIPIEYCPPSVEVATQLTQRNENNIIP